MDQFSTKDIFTISCAVVGAVLGVINTWNGISQRKVRLRVVPKIAFPVSHSGRLDEMGCIEVLNLSTFPLTVTEVGFTIDGDPRKKTRAAIVQPLIHDGKPWPRRLEARESVTAYFNFANLSHKIRKAYVKTDCGEVAYGKSPALQTIRARATA
jgi:hypothetical protein